MHQSGPFCGSLVSTDPSHPQPRSPTQQQPRTATPATIICMVPNTYILSVYRMHAYASHSSRKQLLIDIILVLSNKCIQQYSTVSYSRKIYEVKSLSPTVQQWTVGVAAYKQIRTLLRARLLYDIVTWAATTSSLLVRSLASRSSLSSFASDTSPAPFGRAS